MSPGGDNTQHVAVTGELDAASVPQRLRESADWFQSDQKTVVDLGGIERADSAGVALLLEWVREARAANAWLAFANAPEQMRAIIDFCALDGVIPLQASDRASG